MRLFKATVVILLLFFSTVVSAQQVRDFSFKDINGKYHRFSEYKGKWVIVNYWSTY